MTFGEVARAVESYNRTKRAQQQEQAYFDYALADLIGRSVSRIHSSANKMPEIEQVYPTFFNVEEIQEQKQQKKAELSALRFKQFANSYNKRFLEVGEKK